MLKIGFLQVFSLVLRNFELPDGEAIAVSGASGIGVTLAVLAGAYRLTDDRHRLRLDRLTKA